MGKALYILKYQKNVLYDRFDKSEGYISVTARTYEEACDVARRRLPPEKGEVVERDYGGYREVTENKREYRHAFRLVDCLDENHALFVPNQQNIKVDNSNTNYSSSTAIAYRGGLFG